MSFLTENQNRIESLKGSSVASVSLIEMALIESGPNKKPVFGHPEAPFIQAHVIEIELDDSRIAYFSTYQNDDTWGIHVQHHDVSTLRSEVKKLQLAGNESIFRLLENVEFPTGAIINIENRFDEKGDLTEIILTIGNQNVLLKAGEAYEITDAEFRLLDRDEAILLFLDASKINDVEFAQ